MARIRTIKPEFFRHEELQRLGPIPMLVFAGIWTQCDKAGNFPWKPRQLKLDILPFLEFEMESIMDLLSTTMVLTKYVHDGKEYGHVPGFKTHQVIWGSELKAKTRYPDFQGRTEDVLRTQEKGDRKKEEGEGKKDIPLVRKHAFSKSPFFEFNAFRGSLPDWTEEKCRHYHTAAEEYSGTKGVKYLDWRLAVMAWDRKEPFENRRNNGKNISDGRSARSKLLDETASRFKRDLVSYGLGEEPIPPDGLISATAGAGK